MHQIQNLIKTRLFILQQIEGLTDEQLTKIPNGFNNNIVWHLGHLIVTQYSICIRPTGNKVPLEENFYIAYKPGSIANSSISSEEITAIKEMLISKVNEFESNYSEDFFTKYNTWKTPYGLEIKNIKDALDFVNFHEGLHMGYILAMKKLV